MRSLSHRSRCPWRSLPPVGLPLWDPSRLDATARCRVREGRGRPLPSRSSATVAGGSGGELLEREVHDRLGVAPCLGAHRGKDSADGRSSSGAGELVAGAEPDACELRRRHRHERVIVSVAVCCRHRREPLDLLAGHGEGRRACCAAPTRVEVACELETAPDVPVSTANAVTTQVTQAARAATARSARAGGRDGSGRLREWRRKRSSLFSLRSDGDCGHDPVEGEACSPVRLGDSRLGGPFEAAVAGLVPQHDGRAEVAHLPCLVPRLLRCARAWRARAGDPSGRARGGSARRRRPCRRGCGSGVGARNPKSPRLRPASSPVLTVSSLAVAIRPASSVRERRPSLR